MYFIFVKLVWGAEKIILPLTFMADRNISLCDFHSKSSKSMDFDIIVATIFFKFMNHMSVPNSVRHFHFLSNF